MRLRVLQFSKAAILLAIPTLLVAGDKPVKTSTTFQGPIVYEAGEDISFLWDEACSFPVRVDYDETFESHRWSDGNEFLFQRGRDVYTNLETGRSFVEKFNLIAKVDPLSGDWDIKGQCEHITSKGSGTVVLDAGRWIWKSDGTRLIIGGPKDLNDPNLPYPPFSYCELLQ